MELSFLQFTLSNNKKPRIARGLKRTFRNTYFFFAAVFFAAGFFAAVVFLAAGFFAAGIAYSPF